MAGQAIQCRQAIADVIRLRHLPGELVEMLTSANVVSQIDQRHHVVIVLFRGFELRRASVHLNACNQQMERGTASSRFVPAITFCRSAFALSYLCSCMARRPAS